MKTPVLITLGFAISVLGGWSGSRATQSEDLPMPSAPDKWVKRGIILPSSSSGILGVSPSSPGQLGSLQNFNSPAEPLGNGRWRIWYGGYTPKPNIGVAEGIPGIQMTEHEAVLSEGEPVDAPLAIGNLPDGWRPVQPVHIKLRDGRNRLYFWVHAPKERVVRLLAADSNDGRRYRVIDPHLPCLWHFADRAVEFAGTGPTGLRLPGRSEEQKKRFPRPESEPTASPELVSNDGVTIYQLADGSFELYVNSLVSLEKDDPRLESQQNDNLKGYRRAIDRMVSQDGLKWHSRSRVLEPDESDPIDLQFYYLNVTYTPKGRVGMLGHYRLYAQTMDIEWCYSRDGLHWIRPARRPWIQRGKPYDDIDSLMIVPASSLVFDDGKWWLFYTGYNAPHNRRISYGKPQSAIMLAQTGSIWQGGVVPER